MDWAIDSDVFAVFSVIETSFALPFSFDLLPLPLLLLIPFACCAWRALRRCTCCSCSFRL